VRERWKALRCLEYLSKGGMSNALTVDLAGVQKTKWAERTVSEAPKATLRRRTRLVKQFRREVVTEAPNYCQGNPNLCDTKS
jgi:hypothetical protein